MRVPTHAECPSPELLSPNNPVVFPAAFKSPAAGLTAMTDELKQQRFSASCLSRFHDFPDGLAAP